jgi:tRNA A37 methylthiotransferase MiaB/glycosyltransferase involved in cell wall biosynthesis
MKVAILGSRGLPACYSGFDTLVEELAFGLAKSPDCEVLVFCRRSYYAERPPALRGVRLIYLPAPRLKGIESLLHSFLSALYVLKVRPDVVYFVDPANAPFCLLLRLFGQRVVIHADGLGWKRRKWGPLVRRYYKFVEWLAARTAHALVTDNPMMQQYYRRHYGVEGVYIPYGAANGYGSDESVYGELGITAKQYALVVARLEPENNVDLIITEYVRSNLSLPLLIVGDSPYNGRYLNHLRGLGDDRVIFAGRINDQAKLNALYKGALLYLHGHEVGGTNPSLLRAMDAGLSPLVLDVDFNRAVIGDCGFAFSPRPGDLSAAMQHLIQCPDVLARTGEMARQRARTAFRWDVVVADHQRLLQSLAGQPAPAGQCGDPGTPHRQKTPAEPAPLSKLVYVVANGCHENQMDAALVQHYFSEECQYRITDDAAAADLILLLGCSATGVLEDESSDLVAYLKRHKKPAARVVLGGCIAKLNPQIGADRPPAWVPVESLNALLRMDPGAGRLSVNTPYQQSRHLATFLAARKKEQVGRYTGFKPARVLSDLAATTLRALFWGAQRYKAFLENRIDVWNKKTFCIKVSTGCKGNCSYCCIRLSRGAIQSKSIEDVMEEFRRGLDGGHRQFALVGTDLGDYGKDYGGDLGELLRRILEVDQPFQLKLRNINPRWLIPHQVEFCDLLHSGKIAYLQAAVQSGNNRVLQLMRRGYRAEAFEDVIRTVRETSPGLIIRTQFMVGFPSETEEEFEQSVRLYDTGLFDYAEVFPYARRSNTDAANILPEVPRPVAMRRYRRLIYRTLFRQPLRKLRTMARLKPD